MERHGVGRTGRNGIFRSANGGLLSHMIREVADQRLIGTWKFDGESVFERCFPVDEWIALKLRAMRQRRRQTLREDGLGLKGL